VISTESLHLKNISMNLRNTSKVLYLLCILWSFKSSGQVSYLGIFGNAGCSNNYKLPCNIPPSSATFSSVSDLLDLSVGPEAGYNHFNKNSTFDYAGNLLFSVNTHGIYGSSGTQLFSFSGTIVSSAVCSGSSTDIYTSVDRAASEIVTVPVSGECRSFYVFFWQHITPSTAFDHDRFLFRCVKVVIGAGYPADAAYSFTDKILNNLTCSGYDYTQNWASAQVVADKYNPDGSRDIYTVHSEGSSSMSNTKLLRWRIAASGVLPVSPVVVASSLPTPRINKMKLFNLPISGGGTHKTLAYAVFGVGAQASLLYTLDLSSGIPVYYKAPLVSYGGVTATNGYQTIWGFEYLPSQDIFCFAYREYSFVALLGGGADTYTLPVGGLAYAARATSGVNNMTPISSTTEYLLSDLELTKHGDLMLVRSELSGWPYPASTGGPANLAYLPASSLSALTTSSPSLPTEFALSSCATTPDISVGNLCQSLINTFGFYLGTQIRGENYDDWGNNPLTVNITTPQTWTPYSNPVNLGVGPAISTINMGNITIQPGASLTISGMTVKMASNSYIDVLAGGGSTPGARFYVDNSTITAHTGGCDNPAFSMWGGVRIYGVPSAPQVAIGSSPLVQGYMKTTNSEISYATTGVWVGTMGSGGGRLEATTTTFKNNTFGVSFNHYAPINHSFFHRCKFLVDDHRAIPYGTMVHLSGGAVRGIWVGGCEFDDATPNLNSTGIFMTNSCFTVDRASDPAPGGGYTHYPSKFSRLDRAIEHSGSNSLQTATIRNSIFSNNKLAIKLNGSFAPVVVNNEFQLPFLGFFPASPYSSTIIQSIGIQLWGATNFSVYGNKFQFFSASGLPPFSYSSLVFNTTIGIQAWNTGSAENMINNNTFKGLGTANLANYKNKLPGLSLFTGLRYKCNINNDNYYDLAIRGSNNYTDGVRRLHGNGLGGAVPVEPAGNLFSKDVCDGLRTAIYAYSNEVSNIEYYFQAYLSSTVHEFEPGKNCYTGKSAPFYSTVMKTPLYLSGDFCRLPSIHDPISGSSTTGYGGLMPIIVSPTSSPDTKLMATNSNINYYANDRSGMQHRDSLYYWLKESNSPEATMAIAEMLVEDTLVDSAYVTYASIPSAFNLDSTNAIDFTIWGSRLLFVQISDAIKAGASTSLLTSLEAHIDTLSDSAYTSLRTVELVDIFQNARGYMRVRAENMLRDYNKTLFDSLIAEMPDTLLYPPVSTDSPTVVSAQKGSLVVTELSLGSNMNCQYAELIATNCGDNSSPYVDIRGWIIDDNSGVFNVTDQQNPEGDCDENVGITKGHYRLSYDTLWANIPVGSIIVLYNAANNCYGLPSSFNVDTFNSVFYIPVGSVPLTVLQQYGGDESNPCAYCADQGPNFYGTTSDWMNIIGFDSLRDGLQVRCPGCTEAISSTPAFYHGIGYSSGSASNGALQSAAVMKNNAGAGYKYVFTGSSASDLVAHSSWSIETADTPGAVPPTLGHVSTGLFAAVIDHTLGLPCCADTSGQQQNPQGKQAGETKQPKSVETVRAYPNPANMSLNFDLPLSGEATVRITDIAGRTMAQQTVHNKQTVSFNVKGYTPGVYMYHVTCKGGTFTGKVVIAD